MYFIEQALLLITIQAIFYMFEKGDLTFASIVRACVVWNYLVIHCSPFLFKFLARSPQTRFAVQRLVNPRRKRRTTIGSYVGQRLHSFKVAPERRSRCTTRIIWSKLVWFFHLLDFLSIDENRKKNFTTNNANSCVSRNYDNEIVILIRICTVQSHPSTHTHRHELDALKGERTTGWTG